MPRFRHTLLAALAVPVILLGAAACSGDDNTAESDSSASAQTVDEINARVQRNEMVTALLGIDALPLHDIDETVGAGEEIPGNAIPSMRTLIRLISITDWDSGLQADADAIKAAAEDFITAAESDDHGGVAEAATSVHDLWHDFSDPTWEVVAPGAAPESEGGHSSSETPAAGETPHDEGEEQDEETPEATP